jgi:hypothetical protein
MKALTRRIRRLEDRYESTDGNSKGLLMVVSGVGLALDADTCVEILRECGSMPTGAIGLVDLLKIPKGLDAKETERFLRENSAVICGSRRAQNHGGSAGFQAVP